MFPASKLCKLSALYSSFLAYVPSLGGISCPLLGRKINGYICCVRDKINTDYAYYYENNLILLVSN